MGEHALTLAAEPSEVRRLNTWLEGELSGAGLARKTSDRLKLCLNEAFANVISHAFETTAEPEISVELSLEGGVARAVLVDNGVAFNPLEQPARGKYTDLADADIGGFGVQLIRENADQVAYERAGGRNRLTMACRDTL